MSEPTPAALVASYGTPEHAAREALEQARCTNEGWITSDVETVAQIVVEGLRARGFTVSAKPYCECGWTGQYNHYHDNRLGRERSGAPCLVTGADHLTDCSCRSAKRSPEVPPDAKRSGYFEDVTTSGPAKRSGQACEPS